MVAPEILLTDQLTPSKHVRAGLSSVLPRCSEAPSAVVVSSDQSHEGRSVVN